jgi:hypothetical protein
MGTAGRMKSSTLNRCSLFTLIRKKSRVRDFDVTLIVTYSFVLSIETKMFYVLLGFMPAAIISNFIGTFMLTLDNT